MKWCELKNYKEICETNIYIPALVKIKLLDELTVNGYILSSLQVLPEKKLIILISCYQVLFKKSDIVMPMKQYYDTFWILLFDLSTS